MTLVAMDKIRVDGGTQTRATTRRDIIDEYFEAKEAGATLPEADVFFDGDWFWMADGFSRYFADVRLGSKEMDCKIHEGGRREALLFGAGANATHGAKRTNEDKRHAVRMILSDPEWVERSNRWVAEHCKVGDDLVKLIREQMDKEKSSTAGNDSSNNEKDRKEEGSSQSDTGESSNDADSSTNGRYRQHEKEEQAKEDAKEEKPKKRKGKDGKERPARKPKAGKKPKEKKSGQVVFDDTPYPSLFGKLVRFMDDRGAAYTKDCLEFQDIMTALECVDQIYKRWKKHT